MLKKGASSAPEQMQEAYTDEQQREIKRGLILLEARRKWRLCCLALFGILSVITFLRDALFTHMSIGTAFVEAFVGWGIGMLIIYGLVTFFFLYIFANWGLKIFLYFKDLKNSENTRL